MASKKDFKFMIDKQQYEWPEPLISGQQLRDLPPGIPDGVDLYLRVRGRPGELIEKDQQVDLDQAGLEKFYTQDASSEAG